jgi:hypothetical protein
MAPPFAGQDRILRTLPLAGFQGGRVPGLTGSSPRLDRAGARRNPWSFKNKQEDTVPEPIIPILEAMKTSHQNHLERLERWKAEGGKLENYPNNETIDDFINRERLAVSRFTMSIEHLKKHENHPV